MNPITFLAFFLLVTLVKGAPTTTVDDKGKEELAPSTNEASPSQVDPTAEKEPSTEEKLTPSQQGRLARFNGNFFQLYGATNQLEGNLDAIAGNQLQYRGNLIEFLGNEHSLRQLSEYLKQAQLEREADAQRATGREKELEEEEVNILGELKDLVTLSAVKEHEQAQEKAKQFNLETRQYKLEKEETQLKAQQAVSELEQGNLEEEQIGLENKGRKVMGRLIDIEIERQSLPKQPEPVPATHEPAAPETPVSQPETAPTA